jgi:myb proto-oncogene protein
MLKDAVQRDSSKNWGAISVLVPGRTKYQRCKKWHDVMNPIIGGASRRTGKWTAVENSKLKDAVQTHGGTNWDAISALIPGRTKRQCYSRWHDVLNPSIDLTAGREGKWTEDEDSKFKDAVHTHGSENCGAVAALVPGRTHEQCRRGTMS